MPSRHCLLCPGVEPRFCARHLAKNPPPAPSPPALASAELPLAAAPPLAPAPGPQACLPTVLASGTDHGDLHPALPPDPPSSPPPAAVPPPLARTPRLASCCPSCLPLAAPFLLSVHSFTCLTFGVHSTSIDWRTLRRFPLCAFVSSVVKGFWVWLTADC